MKNSIIERDLQHIWHPCSQMKDFETSPPFIVASATGSYLNTDKGTIIDAISSWWCKSLGHAHPPVISAIQQQLNQFEHVITANSTNENIAKLGEVLADLTDLPHVFFASDGSSAVEIAMKLAIQAKKIQGKQQCNEFIALKNAYHGETLAALSVSDLGLYKKPFENLSVTCHFLQSIPYIENTDSLEWENAEHIWSLALEELELVKQNVCAIIVEPIIQGAGGMRCYSADFLQRLADWAHKNDIYLIADEIMTGLYRTGKFLASEHADIKPDIVCLSKGLTSGSLPFSATLTSQEIYNTFYDDYSNNKSFLHSHTYSGNALGVAAALATIKSMKKLEIDKYSEKLGNFMQKCFTEVAEITGKLKSIRSIGTICAADLIDDDKNTKRLGFKLYQQALKNGALLRPLGNTLYWLPPLNTDFATITKLAEITIKSIKELY